VKVQHLVSMKTLRVISTQALNRAKGAARIALLVALSLCVSAVVGPRLLGWWESASGSRLHYEAALRIYLAITMIVSWAATALFGWTRFTRLERRIWAFAGVTLPILLAIFAFDSDSPLMDEFSWIRYPTAAALIGAGGLALLVLTRAWRSGAARHLTVLWFVLACGFVFGGLDEIFQVHENLANWVRLYAYPVAIGDLVTFLYAFGGVGVLVVVWRFRHRASEQEGAEIRRKATDAALEPWLIRGYFNAVVIFGISQLFDSGDKLVLVALRQLAGALADAGHSFPDLWYLIYEPRQLMNSIEEILECVAAMLFLVVTWQMVRWGRDREDVRPPARLSVGWAVGRLVFAAAVVALTVAGWSSATRGSPFEAGPYVPGEVSMRRSETVALSPTVTGDAHLSGGERPSADRERGEIVWLDASGGVIVRLRLRRMFRDLLGVAPTSDAGVHFQTANVHGTSFLPHILWQTKLPPRP
jgi:hypothetical protein